MIGQVIGQYKVLEKIGEGGMGVVYKAHDTKLDRVVALKFLPHHLTIHDEERARFLQEARAASALSHPNVCVIHDLQEHGDEHFIVMEYIEGGTLREKLSAAAVGPEHLLPLDTVVSYAIQIGEALQEAHAKGIVHRDVKAENIMVTPRGQIKVMDFGLAKLKGSLKLTRTSSTVGTLAYMAPEQLQGGEADTRSDIFSFGVVLYEMVTGVTPFRGGHEAAMMYSILNEEPQPPDQLRPGLPAGLVLTLNKALEKNPDERYQSVGEMVIDLRRLKRQSTKVTRTVAAMPVSEPAGTMTPPPAHAVGTRKRYAIPLIGALLLIAVAAVWFTFLRGNRSGPLGKLNPEMNFRVLQIPFMQVGYPGLSQDGNWVAFPAAGTDGRWDVYFMNALGGGPRRITQDSSKVMNQCDVSPDGSQIAYDRGGSVASGVEVLVVSSLGGVSKRIASPGILPRWRPDGERIGYIQGWNQNLPTPSGKLELWSARPDGSDQRLEYRDSVSVQGRFSYSWSPDGKSIAWIKSYPGSYQEVFVHELSTGKERQLTHDQKNIDEVCWTHQGEIIFSSNKSGNMNLWMVAEDGGNAVQLTKGSGPDFGIKVSADGTRALYYQFQPVQNIWISGIDGSGAHQLTSEDRRLETPSISPDGSEIVFAQYEVDPAKSRRTLIIMDRNGANRRELTSGEGIAEMPQWSPDGKSILFITHRPDEVHVEHARVVVVDAANPVAYKVQVKGLLSRWLDNGTIAVADGKKCYRVRTAGGEPELLIDDSVLCIPVLSGKGALFLKTFGFMEPLQYAPLQGTHIDRAHAVKLNPGPWADFAFGHDDTYIVLALETGRLLRVALPGGRATSLGGNLREFSERTGISISGNGKTIVYTDAKVNGKLVMIENLR